MDPAQLQPGYKLDRYELLCPLAYGGMASVWLARFGGRLGFERMVVVKMILPQFSQDPRFKGMFLDEANIASRIEHSNVARILDVGEFDGNYFIVMEWVDGDSLSKVIRAAEARKSRVPTGVALRVCADAAAGLHAAHTLKDRDGAPLGVVHRDVSPQNILISNAGSTVLIDFGVAKARDRVAQDTTAGQLKGKIRYMAPEQALGKSVDHRADVWSLGAILFELFAGVAPYEGPNEVATLHKLTAGGPPSELPDTTPPAVSAVIGRALAYDPDERYATALELNLALETAMVELNEPTAGAVVAHYTGQLLADRKQARRKAVDNALAAAKTRDSDSPSSSTTAEPPPVSPAPPKQPVEVTTSTLPLEPMPALAPPPADSGPFALTEVPSATSNATLGSAALEFPTTPPYQELTEEAIRRRKVIAAASLGVSLAAGVVGFVLIISAAILRHPKPSLAEGGPVDSVTEIPTAPSAVASEKPPEPSTSAATPTTSEKPAPSSAPSSAPSHKPSASPPVPWRPGPPGKPATTGKYGF